VTNLVLLAVTLVGCATTRRGPDAPAAGATPRILALAREVAAQSGCNALALTTESVTGAASGWLDAVADSVVDALRRTGVSAHHGRPADDPAPHLVLVAGRSDDPARVVVERRSPEGVATVLRADPPTGIDVAGTAPPMIAGRRLLTGPTFPWLARRLHVRGDGTLVATTPAGAVRLEPRREGDRLTARTLGADARLPDGGRIPHGSDGAFRLADPPAPLRGVPLTGYLEPVAPGAPFVALDVWGTLLYGGAAGLWGPPVSGHAGDVVGLDDAFVTAGAAPPGRPDTLIVATITEGRRLIVRTRLGVGPDAIAGLAALDVDGDGRHDLVVARTVPGGTRIDAYASAGELLP
jgi:hypothetical protein